MSRGGWKQWWRQNVEKAPAVLRTKRWVRQWTGTEPRSRVEVRCRGRERGGWWYCDAVVREGDLVYSFGVGRDLRLERALATEHGARVFAFDPTPSTVEWVAHQDLPVGLRHVPLAIGSEDGELELFEPGSDRACHSVVRRGSSTGGSIRVPVRRLSSIMRELGHERIDHLKLDIEGAEYPVIDDLVGSGIRVRQLLIEFHHRFRSVGPGPTTQALRTLHDAGYRIFHITPNGYEYSFIAMDAKP